MENNSSTIPAIQHVSDTAWLVAALRVAESERDDALFKDPYARMLLGDRGDKILENMVSGIDMSWFMAVRTAVIDEIVRRIVGEQKIDCVVNLACGLDTRSYRLRLPEGVTWFDVDFGDVMEHRARNLKDVESSCTVIPISVDLSDDLARRKILSEATKVGNKILVITEGLLPYLSEQTVINLAKDLLDHSEVRYWLTDYYGASVWDQSREHFLDKLKQANISVLFFPKSGKNFFPDNGWGFIETRSFKDEAQRLKRTPEKNPTMTTPENNVVDPSKFFEDAHIFLLARK